MNILVTGGAGYVGNKLVAELSRYNTVTVLDNFMYGMDSFLYLISKHNVHVIKQDIRNKIPGIQGFDVIYHLAGISGFPACAANPNVAYQVNVDATKQLVNSLSPSQLLIYASTTSFYGNTTELCTEETVCDPISQYGRTKWLAEQIVMQRNNSTALRFATIFGVSPKMRVDLMVNDFVYRAMKEGVVVLFDSHAKRTFLHIDDAIQRYVDSLDFPCGVYNIGDETLNLSKKEIAEAVKEQIPYKIIDSDVKDKDLRSFEISFQKLRQQKPRPTLPLSTGITELKKLFDFYEYYSHFKTL